MSHDSGSVGFGATKKPAKKKRRKMSETAKRRIKLYSAGILRGMSKKDAALMAGYSKTVAENALSHIERPNREHFQRLADKFIPDELLMLRTRQGLDATVIKTANFEGRITDEREYADFQTRAKYIELAAGFKDRAPAKEPNTSVGIELKVVHIGGHRDQIAAQAAALVISDK